MNNVYNYILVMTVTTFLIRYLPLVLLQKKITNRFIRSFLYYVPYVTLAVMTFPAIIYATKNVYSGIIALIIGIIASYKGFSLIQVTAICCAIVFVIELFI